jgi:uncharacterized protein (TIGR00730 family)
MRTIRRIAVYCGSNFGDGEAYRNAAAALGRVLAEQSIELVYGGTHKGLMGVLADAAIKSGGRARGVITQRLYEKGHLHPDLHEHEIVATMRERKGRMIDVADAFIALPGGIGTLEEFMEVWTLNQLGEIEKPLGLFNVENYYQPFTTFIDHMISTRFLPEAHRHSIVVAADANALVDGLRNLPPMTTPKWMS